MNKKLEKYNNKLKESNIAILGLGVSNIPLLEYLYELGSKITVFNTKELDSNLIEKLDSYNIKYYIGENALDNLVGFDIIFRSPSILPTRKELVEATGKASSYIQRCINQLKETKRIHRVGPDKGGFWEIINPNEP